MVHQIRMTEEFVHKVFVGEIAGGLLGVVPVEDCQVGNNAHHEHYLVDKLVGGAMEGWGRGGVEEGRGGREKREEEGMRRRGEDQSGLECKCFCFAAVHHVHARSMYMYTTRST